MHTVNAYAYDLAVENADGKTIYYNYINDGTELEVTYKTWQNNINWTYNKEAYYGDIVIPSEVTYMNRTRKVTSISAWAFNNCIDMTSISIPSTIKTIYGDAFYNCAGLKKVITQDIDSWCKIAFVSNSFGSIWDGNPLEYAHHLYSDENTEITSVVIPNGISYLAMSFSGCSGLKHVSIPESIKELGWGTFNGCSGLTDIIIPNSVEKIDLHVFNGCSSLKSIEIPSSVTSIGYYALAGCTNLSSISVDDKNPIFDSRDNCNAVINTAKNELVSGCKNTIIPHSITSIGANAFQGCIELNSIEIPNNITHIGYAAFIDCSGLKTCIIPKSVSFIDSYAFWGCVNLVDVISQIEDPFNITTTNTFEKNTIYNGTLYVPEGTIEKYKSKKGWRDFVFIEKSKTNGIVEVDKDSVMLQSKNGVLNITGAPEGCLINVYDLSGKMVGSAKAGTESTIIPTTFRNGDIGIVKIGEKRFKISIK